MDRDSVEAQRMKNIPFSGIRTVFEECSRLEAEGMDLVHLEVGRPDFDTPEPIKRAGIEAIQNGYVHYTSNYGIPELRKAIANKYETENAVSYDSNQEIVVTSGGTEAYLVSILALVESGDEVLIPDPSWTYKPAIRMAGGSPIRYELQSDDGFQPDVKDIKSSITSKTKLLILNSPQNPTGGVVSESVLKSIRDLVVEHDLYLLSDEIYEKIIFDGRSHHSPAALNGLFDRTITLNGFSKAYSMTGWRLGYLCAPKHLVDSIVRIRQYTTTCASSIAQHAGVVAIQSPYHRPLVNAFQDRRDLVMDRIDDVHGMQCPEPSGAFYAFPTIPSGFSDDEEFVFDLLRETGVALVPGTVFSESRDGHLRIAFSNSSDRIEEAFDRIEEFVR